jgi:hypothetical protein
MAVILRALFAIGVACLPLRAAGPDPALSQSMLAAADGCAMQAPALTRAACDNPTIRPLSLNVRRAMAAAASALSPKGQSLAAEDQRRWFASQRMICGLEPERNAIDLSGAACVERALRSRLGFARILAERRGPFVIERRQMLEARLLPGDARRYVLDDATFPRIDALNPQAAAFNDAAEAVATQRASDNVQDIVSYRIAYAGADIVSVRFDSSRWAVGAERPTSAVIALTVRMRDGRRLEANDVFLPSADWRAFLMRRVREGVGSMAAAGLCPGANGGAINRAVVADPAQWLIQRDRLAIVLPQRGLGALAQGDCVVSVDWDELIHFLNPGAPEPIVGGRVQAREEPRRQRSGEASLFEAALAEAR